MKRRDYIWFYFEFQNIKKDPVTIVIGNEACDLDSG